MGPRSALSFRPSCSRSAANRDGPGGGVASGNLSSAALRGAASTRVLRRTLRSSRFIHGVGAYKGRQTCGELRHGDRFTGQNAHTDSCGTVRRPAGLRGVVRPCQVSRAVESGLAKLRPRRPSSRATTSANTGISRVSLWTASAWAASRRHCGI